MQANWGRVLCVGLAWGCHPDSGSTTGDSRSLPDASLGHHDSAQPSAAEREIDAGSSVDPVDVADSDADSPTPTPSSGESVHVAEWTDLPGACPPDATRADISTLNDMLDASRGERFTDATCFFVHDGTYVQDGSTLPLYFRRSGSAAQPITWVGESRDGVVIKGRATFETGADHIVLSNMTLDISEVEQEGAYNTITVLASDVTLSHLTLTGDCAHGLRGGHVEVPVPDDLDAPRQNHVVIDSCLIEKFGHCADGGELDHGIYLSSGNDIQVRNSIIRGNSSRGIQIYTHYEDSSQTLMNVRVERSRIENNGHGDYQDGMVINGNQEADVDGTIDGVVIEHNIFWHNYYSAIRFVGNSVKGVEIAHNTFVADGTGSSSDNRSEINVDEGEPVASVSKNVFVPDYQLLNSCSSSLTLSDNAVTGELGASACIQQSQSLDPDFVDLDNGDFHAQNPLLAEYGAYAP